MIKLCKPKGSTINTGALNQCIEGKTVKSALLRDGFRFKNVDDAVNKDIWIEAIKNKDAVILYDIHKIANANTEASFFEEDSFRFQTKKAVKKVTGEHYLGLCSHRALKSYMGSNYTHVIEFTEDGAIIGVMDGEKVKGQDLSDFNVSIRENTTADSPAKTVVTMTYRDYEELEDNPFAVIPDWDVDRLEGVFNVMFDIVSSSSSEIKLKAVIGCGGELLNGLTLDFFKVEGNGAIKITALSETDGVYTLTGVYGGLPPDGIVTLKSNGIVAIGGRYFEAMPVEMIIN